MNIRKTLLPILFLVLLIACTNNAKYYITITTRDGGIMKKDTITAASDSAAYASGINTFIKQLLLASASEVTDPPTFFTVTDANGNNIATRLQPETAFRITKPLRDILRDTVVSVSPDTIHASTTIPVDTSKK